MTRNADTAPRDERDSGRAHDVDLAPRAGHHGGGRATWIVVPARDEAALLPACLAALQTAAGSAPGPVRVVVVDDGSRDGTADVARATFQAWAAPGRLAQAHLTGTVLRGPAEGVGWARRTGIELALAEVAALGAGALDPLVASTDADTRVDPTWLRALHDALDLGHGVVAGDVTLDAGCDVALAAARDLRLRGRLAALPPGERHAAHPHFAGSNLGFAAAVLHKLGPLPTPRALEDDAVLVRLRGLGIPVHRCRRAVVVTSSRLEGRADAGLAAALRADRDALGERPREASPPG